jgi:peptide/nickel transport system permease protein
LFFIMDKAPGDPAANLPLTLPAEVRERIREAAGFNDPFLLQWLKWCRAMFIYEPLHLFQSITGLQIREIQDTERIISWSSRSPALDTIYQRLPQTLWVLGLGTLFGTIIAIPIGIISAYKQYSLFDNVGTFISMLGFSLPVYFTGLLAIVIFSVKLQWFPSIYDTTHDVQFTSWDSIWIQIKQLVMPVSILTLFQASTLARFTRASALDNLNQEYVRTARSKGLSESKVVNRHVMRNSLIPVVTLLALAIPGVIGGAIITETVFRINGIGQLLITSIRGKDVPMVQTITFFSAFLVVVFNLVADALYGLLDPRIRYE